MKHMKALLILGCFLVASLNTTCFAKDKLPVDPTQFQDEWITIYLTEDRVCKKCTWRLVRENEIELKNKLGERGIYKATEILGATKHPLWRKFAIHAANHTALPGENILPSAVKEPTFHYNGNHTFAEWTAEFETTPGTEQQMADQIGNGVFQAGFSPLFDDHPFGLPRLAKPLVKFIGPVENERDLQ